MKKSIEEVREKFLKRGLYLFENQEYINSRTKMSCYDDEGYKYHLSYGLIRDVRIKKYYKVRRENIYSIENIQHYLDLCGVGTKVLSKEYFNEKHKLLLLCECGRTYKEHWNHIYSMNKITCPKCGRKRTADNQRLTPNEVSKLCYDNGYKLIKYVDSRNVYIQDKDGYKYLTALNYIRNQNTYRFSRFSKLNPFMFENMNLYLDKNDIDTRLDENNTFESIKNGLQFICPCCGKSFVKKWEKVAYHGIRLCSRCSNKQSNLEYIVESYLQSENIEYECQKKFEDCKDVRQLPFDFYLTDYNVCIEVQGCQHYYENTIYAQSLEERQRVDKIKEDYCKNNGIKFLAIPYWEICDMKDCVKLKFTKRIQNIINQD